MNECKYRPTFVGPFGTKDETKGFRYRNGHDFDDKRTHHQHQSHPVPKPSHPTIQRKWQFILTDWIYKLPNTCKVKPKITDDLEPYY